MEGGKIGVAFANILRSRQTKVTLLLLATYFAIRKLREKKARLRILSAHASRIEVVVRNRDENIEWARKKTKSVNNEERKRIEEMDFTTLRASLQSGAVSAETVVRVYYGLAIAAHEKTNCLTNIIKEALTEAKELDRKAKDPSYKKPRLFGLPISIKDSVEVKGQRCTWGLAALTDYVPNEDSYPVMKLREEGMIPFCQTNVPTTCMSYMTSNSIFGTTTNPLSPSRTSGGSSGGEGALISSHGSLIGIGSDIGGSIRIPSSYSGCCGFKPSATRFSTGQLKEPLPWRPMIMPTEGPLAQDPHAIVEIMKTIWSGDFISSHDSFSVPVNFREDLFKEGKVYRIGFYTSDGYIDPLPGNQRVIGEAAELLKKKGHTLVPFSLDDIVAETARGIWATINADGGTRTNEVLKNEPFSSLMEPLRSTTPQIPKWTDKARGLFAKMRGDKVTADFYLYRSSRAIDVQAGINRIFACRKRLVQKMKEEGVDLLLCPTTICPAMPHSLPNDLPFTAIMATMQWNTMDFPAGVVTIGKWSETDEKALESYKERGLVETAIKRGCKNSIGLPLSVQLVAPAFRDEMVLRAMVDLYDALKEGEKSRIH